MTGPAARGNGAFGRMKSGLIAFVAAITGIAQNRSGRFSCRQFWAAEARDGRRPCSRLCPRGQEGGQHACPRRTHATRPRRAGVESPASVSP